MHSFKGLLYAVISSATFGLIPLFAIPALQAGVAVNTVVFYRFFISAIAMGLVILIKGTSLRISKEEYKTICWLSIFYGATSLLLTLSYLYIPSGMATTIHFLYPVLVTLIMILMFREKGSLPIYFATALAICGVSLLGNTDSGDTLSTTGLTLALITVCTYATYIVGVQKSGVKHIDGLKLTFYVLLNCAGIFFINTMVQDGSISPIPDITTGINLVLLALIPTLVSNLTLILAVKHIGSTSTAVLGCMEPMTAVTMGVLFLGETCNNLQLTGIGIILIAVTLVIIGGQKRRKNT